MNPCWFWSLGNTWCFLSAWTLEKRRWDLMLSERRKSCLTLQETADLCLSCGNHSCKAALGHPDLQPYPMGTTVLIPHSESLCRRSKTHLKGSSLFVSALLLLVSRLIHSSLFTPYALDFAITLRFFKEESCSLIGLSPKFIKGCFPWHGSYHVPSAPGQDLQIQTNHWNKPKQSNSPKFGRSEYRKTHKTLDATIADRFLLPPFTTHSAADISPWYTVQESHTCCWRKNLATALCSPGHGWGVQITNN